MKSHCIGFPVKYVLLTPSTQTSIFDSEEPGSLGMMSFLKEILLNNWDEKGVLLNVYAVARNIIITQPEVYS